MHHITEVQSLAKQTGLWGLKKEPWASSLCWEGKELRE